MSQSQKQKNCNGKMHHYSQSQNADVSDVINLINFVVDQDENKNKSSISNPIPKSGRKTLLKKQRSNSSHSIISPRTKSRKIKTKAKTEQHMITSSPATINTNNTNPVATNLTSQNIFMNYEHSPVSMSSSMDFDNSAYRHITEDIKQNEPLSIDMNCNYKMPTFNNKLSTVLSVGILEMEDNTIIDKEYAANHEMKMTENKNHTNEHSDINHPIDIRSNEECKLIMFLYNSKSGGQKAVTLLKYFRAYTSLIYDLFALNSSDQEIEKLAYDLTTYENKIVVCIVGGDGSQCWATSLIDRAIKAAPKTIAYPTIVPFPVGTGNDLSRSLGWGYMERTPAKIIKHIADVEYGFNITKRFSVLDRWSVQYSFPHLTDHEQTSEAADEYIQHKFSPPLPKQFLCYLSFGYDAMITYNFAMERKNNPDKFKSQLSNQTVYIKMGLKEFMKPSNPVNDSIQLFIDGELCTIPQSTRSLKLVNINSAASGVFFWGYLKSNKDELQNWKRPQLNDGLIEVMATRGSSDLAKAKTKMGHAHRLGQSNDIVIKIVKVPMYLQIDGEGWMIDKLCTLNIKLADQLPTLIGYKFPRGVYHKYTADYYTDKIKQARHRYRNVVKMKYNIPNTFPRDYDPQKPMLNKMKSTDDFNLNMNGNDECKYEEKEVEIMEKEDKKKLHHKSMSELVGNKWRNNNEKKIQIKKPTYKWKPLFANKNSWKRNKTNEKKKNKKGHRRMSWF